ncbi:hypothetical protein DM01DRAFT_1408627 [Hesseltinella vesiculosa]|uniref:Neurochondrin-domain-containing protein n=1 Tax=Hesseltinella vesiculosa TaxID=101127 RepID=A0A1X2GE74_9FUNG|nr:hypothetical protein DM01DRAFT_1408627 [Hesseltinella vesiculosa]
MEQLVTGSSARDRKAEIDRCLQMIAPNVSDESKFVGMLLLPRLLPHDDHAMIKHVFQGMNFKFIERLLRTNHQIDQEVPDHVLKEIAINVLACFAHFDDLAPTTNMVDRLPALSTTLSASDDTDNTKEALNIFIQVATTKEGLVRMLDPDVLKNILEVYSGTKDDDLRLLCSQVLSLVFTRTSEMYDQHQSKPSSIASLTSAAVYALETTMLPILTSILHHGQDKLRITTLTLLYHILASVPYDLMVKVKQQWTDTKRDKALDNLYKGLRQILASKVGDKMRDEALTVASCSLRAFGPDWLFSWLKKTSTIKATDNPDYVNARFPVLLIALVSVESRVLLDQVHDQWIANHGGDGTDRVIVVNQQQQERHHAMVPVYFNILEDTIEYLASQYDEEKDVGMDPDALLKIRKSLTEVMDVVMELTRFMQDTADDQQELDDNLLTQACMRIVSLWLAEEGFEL